MMMLKIYFLTLFLTLLVSGQNDQIPYATFEGDYPLNYGFLGRFEAGTKLKIVLTTLRPNQIVRFNLRKGNDLFTLAYLTPSSKTNELTAQLTYTISQTQKYWINYELTRNGVHYLECELKVFVNEVLFLSAKRIFYKNLKIPIYKFSVANACKLKINYFGASFREVSVHNPDGASVARPFAVLRSNEQVSFPRAGDYYISLYQYDQTLPQPYRIRLTTSCNSYCVIPGLRSPCGINLPIICGDGILGENEECDNGKKPGCNNCKIELGYECQGGLGSTSLCSKPIVCGDGIVDQGQECDNGNKVGCSVSCKPDIGYKCTAVFGKISTCGLCGNGIVEEGEECDSKNTLGCSSNCKVDVGFACLKTTPSFCYRRNPFCGNNVNEVGESCDDGNTKPGDGCSNTCRVQIGYQCVGELGQPSLCSISQGNAFGCGNSIFEPSNNEQCDNGNNIGCQGCVVQPGYDCTNNPGFPSSCKSKQAGIPSPCGNGVYEPLQNQVCDDGNKFDGDGCSSFCQVQFGWVCIDNVRCLNLQDPKNNEEIKIIFCGNGIKQQFYGEECDDGDRIDGDGCSSSCLIESGWQCRIQSEMGNKSYCSRLVGSGFCGNGVIEGNEECDDGFPLREGDGCSTDCRLEAGWNCATIYHPQETSKCWQL